MKFMVHFVEGGEAKTIEFDCADMETCRKAANQWRVGQGKIGRKIQIKGIFDCELMP
jgi:hypothetical protein